MTRWRCSSLETSLIDCTGGRSLLRDHLTVGAGAVEGSANTLKIRLEYALVITFLYGQNYDCNESCKYYKNAENPQYKFIPMVYRTHYDGSVTHVTGVVNISPDDYEAMPSRFDGEWLRSNFPPVADSMDRFIDKIKEETHGEMLGDLEIVRIPLQFRPPVAGLRHGRRTAVESAQRFRSQKADATGGTADRCS